MIYDPERALWKPGRRSFLFMFGAAIVAPSLPDAVLKNQDYVFHFYGDSVHVSDNPDPQTFPFPSSWKSASVDWDGSEWRALKAKYLRTCPRPTA